MGPFVGPHGPTWAHGPSPNRARAQIELKVCSNGIYRANVYPIWASIGPNRLTFAMTCFIK